MSEHNEPKPITISEPMRFGKTAFADLANALRGFLDAVEEPPPPNCSCHINPPCHDCTEYAHLREVFADARRALKNAEAII